MTTIVVNDFEIKDLVRSSKLKIVPGKRYGLVGKNGSGKTTLLKRISKLKSEARICYVEQEFVALSCPVLKFIMDSNDELKCLDEEELKLTEIESEEPELLKELTEKLNRIQERREELKPWEFEKRAKEILRGLGFAIEPTKVTKVSSKKVEEFKEFKGPSILCNVDELSGGWQMRAVIARAIFNEPDILLLDEPTNHLDFNSISWLEDYLKSYSSKKSIIFVSHDRKFLDSVSTDIIHLENKMLNYYHGNYTTFKLIQKTNLARHEKLKFAQDKKILELKNFIEKSKSNENISGIVQTRIKLLAKMESEKESEEEKLKPFTFSFYKPAKLRNATPLVSIKNLTFFYRPSDSLYVKDSDSKILSAASTSETPLLNRINIRAELRSRVAVVAKNGQGKSTLLKLIKGEIEPVDGKIEIATGAIIATFSQHHIAQLDPKKTPAKALASCLKERKKIMESNVVDFDKCIDSYKDMDDDTLIKFNHYTASVGSIKKSEKIYGSGTTEVEAAIIESKKIPIEQEVLNHLGAFKISKEMATRKIETLSGGEKSRLVFSMLTYKKPHILILDEPTNHLDVESVEALIESLKSFEGCVFCVSHDQYFLESIANEYWAISASGNGKISKFTEFQDAKNFAYDGE